MTYTTDCGHYRCYGQCRISAQQPKASAPVAPDATDWRAEAERLRGLLSREQQERHAMLGRTDAALAALAQARDVLREAREMLIGDPHMYRGQCPQPDDTDARDPECPACAALVRIDAALAAKGK